MNVVLIGAGAIGGSMAAYLTRAGRDILYVDALPKLVDAVNKNGLRIIAPCDDFTVRPRAMLMDDFISAEKSPLDIVFLAVKSQNTEEVMRLVAPLLSENGFVVSLQNGINGYLIAEHTGKERVVCSFVNWVADTAAPGVINFSSKGSFAIGELCGGLSERLFMLKDFLAPFEDVSISSDILRELWSKQVNICVMFATGISHLRIPGGLDYEPSREAIAAIALEAMQVPEKLGIELVSFDDFAPELYKQGRYIEAMKLTADHYRRLKKDYTGLYRDLALKKCRSEIDGTVGAVVSIGEREGVSLPLCTRLVELVKEIEEGRREVCTENLLELKKAYEKFYPRGLPSLTAKYF